MTDVQHETERAAIQRRTFLQLGAAGAAAVAVGAAGSIVLPALRSKGLMSKDGLVEAGSLAIAGSLYPEAFPTSPLILSPFPDELPVLKALSPEPYDAYTG